MRGYERLGVALRRARLNCGYTQTQAGELVGLSQSRINNIECAKGLVKVDQFARLARVYGLPDSVQVELLDAFGVLGVVS